MDAQPLRILIAEDDSLVAELVEHELESRGILVVGQANDGRRAVALTCALRPDAVLMDIRMPELNGIDAAREIQRVATTPVVMLTAHAEPELLAQAAEAGVGAYLVKPVRGDELIRAIAIAIARAADLAELRRVNAELRTSLHSIRTLSGLLPICSACKKIRDDGGTWREVDVYVRDHTAAEFTHGICPDCVKRLYPLDQDQV
jgi:AmiR/NasT family two-component response regulator